MIKTRIRDLSKIIKPYKRYSVIFNFDFDIYLTYDDYSYVTDPDFVTYQIPIKYIDKWRFFGLTDLFEKFQYGKNQLWFYRNFDTKLSNNDIGSLLSKMSIDELTAYNPEFHVDPNFTTFNTDIIHLNPLDIVTNKDLAHPITKNILYTLYMEDNKIYINDCFIANINWFEYYNNNQYVYIKETNFV